MRRRLYEQKNWSNGAARIPIHIHAALLNYEKPNLHFLRGARRHEKSGAHRAKVGLYIRPSVLVQLICRAQLAAHATKTHTRAARSNCISGATTTTTASRRRLGTRRHVRGRQRTNRPSAGPRGGGFRAGRLRRHARLRKSRRRRCSDGKLELQQPAGMSERSEGWVQAPLSASALHWHKTHHFSTPDRYPCARFAWFCIWLQSSPLKSAFSINTLVTHVVANQCIFLI